MATIKSYTDLEQSRKLAEILPLKSADMYWIHVGDGGDRDFWKVETIQLSWRPYKGIKDNYLPCWSLAALLGVIKEQGIVDLRFLQSTFDNRGNHLTNVCCCTFEDIGTVTLDLYADNPIDACVAMIEKLHELKML